MAQRRRRRCPKARDASLRARQVAISANARVARRRLIYARPATTCLNERATAMFAIEVAFASVRFFVALQIALRRKTALAMSTRVWTLAGVCSRVHLEAAGIREAFRAIRASIAALILLMHLTDVQLEVIFECERFGAMRTFVNFLAVRLFVRVERRWRREFLIANWTLVVANAKMRTLLVHTARSILRKLLVAMSTSIRPVSLKIKPII